MTEEILDEIRYILKSDSKLAFEKIEAQLLHFPENIELLCLKAQILESFDKIPEAINILNLVLRSDSNNKQAKVKQELLYEILRYRNSDIYANPNLGHDPWLE